MDHRTPNDDAWDGVWVECDAEGTRFAWLWPGLQGEL